MSERPPAIRSPEEELLLEILHELRLLHEMIRRHLLGRDP